MPDFVNFVKSPWFVGGVGLVVGFAIGRMTAKPAAPAAPAATP